MDNFSNINAHSPTTNSQPLSTPIRPITPKETNTSMPILNSTDSAAYELPSPTKQPDTEFTTESVKIEEQTMVSNEESIEISNGDRISTYKSDVTEVHVKCVWIESSSASVADDGVCLNVTDGVTSETDIIVSNGETLLQDTDLNMTVPVKTTEIQITTCTSEIEPVIDANNVE